MTTDDVPEGLPERFHTWLAEQIEMIGANITVNATPPSTPTVQEILAEIDKIEESKPILFCPPGTKDKFTTITERSGLHVRVIETDVCPVGEVILKLTPTLRDKTETGQNVDAPRAASGYHLDHIPIADRCCDGHNISCEPAADLCCDHCSEAQHWGFPNIHMNIYNDPTTFAPECVLARCQCTSEQQHLDTTQAGWRSRPGYREPRAQP